MARWSLVVILALIQGSLALSIQSPDVAEEEWETFNNMLRDPAYRLPTDTRPHHYEVSLTPYFDNVQAGQTPFTIDGNVVIYINATSPNVNEIVMHCDDLQIISASVSTIVNGLEISISLNGGVPTCEMPYAFLRLSTSVALDMDREYIVRIAFTGNIQETMRGFYRSWYNDANGRRWMGTTQFQPGHARQAFPCYDEPGFKATFDITINRETDFSPTISNMPIRTNLTLSNGRIAETFYTTPVTSTYLLAFIVSHYEAVAENTDPSRPFHIYARNNAGSTGDWSLEIGEALLVAMEEYTNISYYGMAENMNMKQAAIPDFSAGAMENWGLLTYREALILYDPQNSNHFYRQRVANIVSHEIAHMWFGNLVTCAWWDNLWLNEGFARFYQYYLTGSVRPELGFETRFIVEQLQVAMFSDSVDSAHALTDPSVNNPTQVSNHFSTITYARGAAVLRMTQYLLGEETYLSGLRAYLADRQFDVAEPDHLFNALDAAAAADGALANYPGITISEYFKTWSEQAGHPLLTVTIDHTTGSMVVHQGRWERNSGTSNIPTLYQIPITWTRGGDIDFENLKPTQILTDQVTLIERGTNGLEWVIFNKQESGFYRVNYDDTTWGLITRALRGPERTSIHEFNRAQIVNDVFAFARADIMTYRRALNILSFLEFEDAYAPWLAAIDGFNWVIRRLAHDPVSLQNLQNEIIRLSAAVTARLGFSEIPNEPYMDGLLRMYVNEFFCDVGHEQCIAAAVASFQSWRNGGFIPANMRPWVYCNGLRQGTAADFAALWQHYAQEQLANEQVVLLQYLGCTTDQNSLWSYLDQIVSLNDTVRPQDYTTAMNSATNRNEVNTLRVFTWLQNNVQQTTLALGSITTPINNIAARLLTETDIVAFQNWLEQNQAAIGNAYTTGINGATAARNNLQWSAQRLPEFVQYFEEGYVDDVVDPGAVTDPPSSTPQPPSSTESTPEVEPEPDSANVAALSFVTLTAALIVNMM